MIRNANFALPVPRARLSLGPMTVAATSHTRISFVRHGVVQHGQNYYGRLPGTWLGPAGQEQAQATALVLQAEPVAAVFASPLLRTCQTAMAIFERHPGIPFAVDERLLEVFTPFDGEPMAVLEARAFDLYTGVGPPYEQPAAILARARDFIDDICARFAGRHVVAVTHGDVITFLLVWALGHPPEPSARNCLAEWGLPEPYPACASVTTLHFQTLAGETRLIGASYRNPTSGAWAPALPVGPQF